MQNKWTLIAILCIILVNAQEFHQDSEQRSQANISPPANFANIGEYVTGSINVQGQQGVAVHNYQLDENIQKKYLFITLESKQLLDQPAIAVYNYQTREVIKGCDLSEFQQCYIPIQKFEPSEKIIILVSAKSSGAYVLKTRWEDLEHIRPNQKITFIFGEENSQLMHLQFDENEQFEQIRIILSPQTHRATFDKLKIFVNYGTNNQPTEDKHDLQSKRIWGDAEGVFITKKQLKDINSLYIYIVGNAETVYELECEFIRQLNHDIELNERLNEYIQGKHSYTYHIDGSKYDDQYDQYIFKFSVFSGEIEVRMFTDKQLTKTFDRKPLQYMSDIEIFFTKEELLTQTKQLFFQIYCPDASAIYSVSVSGRKQSMAYSITQDEYQFILLNKGEKKSAYLKYPVFVGEDDLTDKNQFIFTVSELNVFGQYSLMFYACNVELKERDKCIDLSNQQEFSKSVLELKPVSQVQVGSKVLHTLVVSNNEFKYNTMVSKEVMIMAVMSLGSDSDRVALGVLQFSNPNKIKQLRQDKSIQQQVLASQTRIYKFQNTDPKVQSIKIYYNHIGGFSKVHTTREDPRLKKNVADSESGKEGSTVYEFTEKLTSPIYIKVEGITNSIFTLAATVRHQEHPDTSALSLSEDVSYKFYIQPLNFMVIQIHPIQPIVNLKYQSTGGPIYICQMHRNGTCQQENKSFVNLSAAGEIQINSTGKSSIKFKLINGFINPYQKESNVTIPNKIQVSVLYHNPVQRHCELKKMNELYNQVLAPSSCMSFHIDSTEDIEIITRKQNLGETLDLFVLCSQGISLPYHNDRYILRKSQITEVCQQFDNDRTLMLMFQANQGATEKVKYQFAVEYKALPLTLKDGISYTYRGLSTNRQSALKSFFFEIIDVDAKLQIILFNKKGTQKFYGKIISNETLNLQKQVNINNAMISSDDGIYYLNPSMEVTPEMIHKSGCTKNCVLVVSVFSTEIIGNEVEFAIEIVYSSVELMENSLQQSFVSLDSFQYYRYQMKEKGQSLFIKVSDSNRHCSKIYVSNKQFPSPSNMIKSDSNGQLILNKTQKQTYYIGVQGIDDCFYSISVSESNANITKMQYGQFYDINLQEDEKKYLLVKHISHKPFKILTLEKHGSLTIYANQTSVNKQLIDLVASDLIKYEDYNFKSHYRNTLIVNNQTGFCSDCFYLIVVVANKKTDSSIVLVGQDAKIVLPRDKILFDEFVNDETKTLVNYYNAQDGQLITKVHQGKVNISLEYKEQKYSYEFSRQKKAYLTNYSFSSDNQMFSPIKVSISPIQIPSLYSIYMRPFQNKTSMMTKITPGEHTYVYLISGSQQCISGYLRNSEELIYLTVSSQDDLKLQKLIITAKLGDTQTQNIKKTIMGNIMTIQFQMKSTFIQNALQYQLCMIFDIEDITLSMVMFQDQNVNILPSNTEYLVNNKNRFVMHPSGDILVDLFVCEGEADIRYANTEKGLKNDKSHNLQKISIPGQNHAIHLQQYQTIFMEVEATQATITWLPLNQNQQKGMGYFNYDIGSLEYQSNFDKLNFRIGGIRQIKQSKSQVKRIKYTLYIAESKENLNKAIMCEKFGEDVNRFIATYDKQFSELINRTVIMPVEKTKIKEKFIDQNSPLYYNVVADLVLTPPTINNTNQQTEEYKFIYFEQQLAKQSFTFVRLLRLDLLIALVIVGVIGFLIVTCVFVRVIVPAIGRLKNRMFVEQSQQKDQSIPIPPSSDRNQVVQLQKPETQEQFK